MYMIDLLHYFDILSKTSVSIDIKMFVALALERPPRHHYNRLTTYYRSFFLVYYT
jgi:hypothetical protein